MFDMELTLHKKSGLDQPGRKIKISIIDINKTHK